MSSEPVSPSPLTATDALIEKCLAGDQQAWDQIVRQHWRKVFNLAYKFVGRHDEAEDLTQDIFLKIFKALHTFESTRQFPDVADQHQPQPLHRSQSQRPQRTRDHARGTWTASQLAPPSRERSPYGELEQLDCAIGSAWRWRSCRHAA
jgi:hypothetical protein